MLRVTLHFPITPSTGHYAPIGEAAASGFNELQTQDTSFQSVSTEDTLSHQLSPDHRAAMNEAMRLIDEAVATANADDKRDWLAIQEQAHGIQQKFERLEALLNGSQRFNEREFETQASLTGHVELSKLFEQLDQLQNLYRARETQLDRENRAKLISDIKKNLLKGLLFRLICLLLSTKTVQFWSSFFARLDAELVEIYKKLQQLLTIQDSHFVSLNEKLISAREEFIIWSKMAPLAKKNKELNQRLENLETNVHLLQESLTESITATLKESLTASLKEQYDHRFAGHDQQLVLTKRSVATFESVTGELKESIADLRKELLLSNREQQEALTGFSRWLLRVENKMDRQQIIRDEAIVEDLEKIKNQFTLLTEEWSQSYEKQKAAFAKIEKKFEDKLEAHQQFMSRSIEELANSDNVQAEILDKFYELYWQMKPKRNAVNANQQMLAVESKIEILLKSLKAPADANSSNANETPFSSQENQAQTQLSLERLKKRVFDAEHLTSMEKALNFSGINRIDASNSNQVQTRQHKVQIRALEPVTGLV